MSEFDELVKKLKELTGALHQLDNSLDEFQKSQEHQPTKEEIWESQLNQMNIKFIEKFLRGKKLQKLNENKM